MNRRYINKLFYTSSWGAAGSCCIVLFFLLAIITWNGIKAVDIEFLFTASRNFGAEGGILYQILGTMLLIIFAAIISFPVALGTAIFNSEYLKNRSSRKVFEILIYGLNGIPSIIFGIFGLIFFVNILDTGLSWFVGSIILGMMILPTIVLSAYQSISSIPKTYRETALSFGFTKWQIIMKVLIPQGIGGGITGLLLGLARAAGETAPIMFIATAFSGVDVPSSIYEPVTALPTHILALTQQATNEQAIQNGWGASLILLCLVITLSMSALFSRLSLKAVSQR